MFNSIHHVAIICSDYERSKKFYLDTLGFIFIKETYREERKSWKLDMQIGNTKQQIELFSFPNPPKRPGRPDSTEACGLRHLAFSVENVQKTTELLKQKGVNCEPIRVDESTGKKFTFFQDPDNLPIEIYEA